MKYRFALWTYRDESRNCQLTICYALIACCTLGRHFEGFIQAQLSSGRYNNASEVVREALRLLEERDRRLAALDAALMRGVADIEAGRLTHADTAFAQLEASAR